MGRPVDETVYQDAVLRITWSRERAELTFHGDITEVSQAPAARVVRVVARESDVLHLDLSELRSCDLADLRAIIGPAADGPPPRRTRIVLRGTPPSMRTALSVVGWDRYAGVSVE